MYQDIRVINEMVQAESTFVEHLKTEIAKVIVGQDYMVDREPQHAKLEGLEAMIEYGASPRASIYLHQAARAHAFLKRRGYVTPEDVKAIGLDILRHRVILTYEAEAEELTSEDIVTQIFDTIEVP